MAKTPTFDTFFIRHSFSVHDSDVRNLIKSGKIAVHYPHNRVGTLGKTDNKSLQPEDYEGRIQGVMRRLNQLASDGGYVCATYSGGQTGIVGFVKPGTKVELLKAKWNDGEREAILKTVQLSKIRRIQPDKLPLVWVGRPRQGTISVWRAAGESIRHLVETGRLESSLSDLTPSRQETMCAEFLRTEEASKEGLPKLNYLLLPVGRTMMNIDVFGLANDGRHLYSQVSLMELSKCGGKIKSLAESGSKDSHRVLFCSCPELAVIDGIQCYPIEKVFHFFQSHPNYQPFLNA